MKIIPIGIYEKYGIKEVYGKNIRQLFTNIQRYYGEYFFQTLKDVKIVLFSHDTNIRPVAINPLLIDIDIEQYNHMAIVPQIEGDEPISLTTIAANLVAYSGVVSTFGLSAKTALLLIDIVTFALQIGVMIGIGALVQAISPTPTTHKTKEAQKKESNLWNGNQATMIQGGPVPMVFGNPFCGGGVIIATGLSTEDTEVNYVPNPPGSGLPGRGGY